MKRVIRKAYLCFVIFIAVLFLYMLFSFRLNREGRQVPEGYRELKIYEEVMEEDEWAPLGFKEIYSFSVDTIEGPYTHVVFLTIHQEIKVYVGEVLIYSMQNARKNKYGKSPGCVWNDIMLIKAHEGKRIRIEVTPVYKSSAGTIPRVYFGTRYSIQRMIFAEEGLEFLMSIVALLLGIFFIAFVLFNSANSEVNQGVIWLGLFAVSAGAWKMSDGGLLKLLFPGFPAISMIPFIALMLGIIPIMLFVKEMYSTREHKLWYGFCWLSIVEIALCLLLQYCDLRDFRQTFGFTIFTLFIGFILFLGMFVYEVRSLNYSKKMLQNTFSILFCFVGMAMDVSAYFLSGGTTTTVIGMLIFVLYIITQGYMAMVEAQELSVVGLRAQNYENMAYHDQLTGLFNRSALAEDTKPLEFDPDKAIMIIFDLNDLKKCNDKLGHDKGDKYIRDSAKLLQNTFKEFGKCYRTGGDEFCCLVTNQSLDNCKKQIELMRQKVEEYNRKSKDIRMAIACGYARYDKRIDYDINDTAKRADQLMYKDKERLKKQAAENGDTVGKEEKKS